MKFATQALHRKKVKLPPGNEAIVSPIYQTAKFTDASLADIEKGFGTSEPQRFLYSRIANPTVRELEINLAAVQGCEDGIAVGSGMAAISVALLGLLQQGEQLLMFYHSYATARSFAKTILPRFGITTQFFHLDQWDALEKAAALPQTKVLFLEAPTNPMLRLPDLQRVSAIARKHDCLVVLDNTFAGLQAHQNADVDLYLHSLTKYVSGHSDVLGGAVLGKTALIRRLKQTEILLGPSLDAHTAFLLLRGLDTYEMRRQKACANALTVAQWLETQKNFVDRVYYPGLASHPDHDIAKKQEFDFGAIITINLKTNSIQQVEQCLKKLKLFKLCASLGSTKSLIAPIAPFYARDLSSVEKRECAIHDSSLRLSIGCEDAQDLIADLACALGT